MLFSNEDFKRFTSVCSKCHSPINANRERSKWILKSNPKVQAICRKFRITLTFLSAIFHWQNPMLKCVWSLQLLPDKELINWFLTSCYSKSFSFPVPFSEGYFFNHNKKTFKTAFLIRCFCKKSKEIVSNHTLE